MSRRTGAGKHSTVEMIGSICPHKIRPVYSELYGFLVQAPEIKECDAIADTGFEAQYDAAEIRELHVGLLLTTQAPLVERYKKMHPERFGGLKEQEE